MKKLVFLFLSLIVLTSCGSSTSYSTTDYSSSTNTPNIESHYSNYVNVKYRSEPVDIANPRFEELNTSKSSWIRGAWYDSINQYMVINLEGTYYHYCGMPSSSWSSFKGASSFGSYYNAYIIGNYDCRVNYVPQYGTSTTTPNYPTTSYNYYSSSSDEVYVYGDCEEGDYCYGEDEDGNEIEIYVYELDGDYGYGEDNDGNEIEFYYDG